MTEKYSKSGKCIYKSINEKENKHEQLGCLENTNQAKNIINELNYLQAWGESNSYVAYSLAQYLKAYDEILDAFIRGAEDEKGIAPKDEQFQYAMNLVLKYLKRLKQEYDNVDEYLEKKKADENKECDEL